MPVRHHRTSVLMGEMYPTEVTDSIMQEEKEEARTRLVAACLEDLDAAIALYEHVQAVLDSGIGPRDFPQANRLRKPPQSVGAVFECVIHLRAGLDDCIELDEKGRPRDLSTRQFQRMMQNVPEFLVGLKSFKEEIDNANVPQASIDAAKAIINGMADDFSVDVIRKNAEGSEWANLAVALVEFVRGMVSYYDLMVVAEAKRAQIRSLDDGK